MRDTTDNIAIVKRCCYTLGKRKGRISASIGNEWCDAGRGLPNRPRLALRIATLENRPGATGLLGTPALAEGQAPI